MKQNILITYTLALFLSITLLSGYAVAGANHTGTVLETMDAGSYTYLHVDENGNKMWVAAPKANVKAGDTVSYPEEVWMQNFKSKTLNRTFDKILFVSSLKIGSGGGMTSAPKDSLHASGGGQSAPHNMEQMKQNFSGGVPKSKTAEPPKSGSIKKASGGFTVAELFSKKGELNGKEIIVRGKVVKIARNIMGKNWIHLQDGTGAKGSNDITMTSTAAVPHVGDVVIGKGILAEDKNFGGGYKYPAIIEESTFTE